MKNKYIVHGMSKDDVKQFQLENGLIADGLVGVKTMNKLLETGKVKKGTEAYSEWLVNNKSDYDNNRSYYPYFLLYRL